MGHDPAGERQEAWAGETALSVAEQLEVDYLRAYAAANGNLSRPPRLTFSRGWWTIYSFGLGSGTKHRSRDIEAMIKVLLARAAKPSEGK